MSESFRSTIFLLIVAEDGVEDVDAEDAEE